MSVNPKGRNISLVSFGSRNRVTTKDDESGMRSVSQQHGTLDEKATIAELVMAASKTQHGVRSIQSCFLYFQEEEIGRAHKSRQIDTASSTVLLAAFMGIVGTSTRLIRVAWGIETIVQAVQKELRSEQAAIITLVVHPFVAGCETYVKNSRLLYARRILALATSSGITTVICMHVATSSVLMANPSAPVEIWIFTTVLVFIAPALALQASLSSSLGTASHRFDFIAGDARIS